jgi:hypothetical protein
LRSIAAASGISMLGGGRIALLEAGCTVEGARFRFVRSVQREADREIL